MDLSVKYDTLQLAQQLLERQAGTHLTNIQSFMDEWCHVGVDQAAASTVRVHAASKISEEAGKAATREAAKKAKKEAAKAAAREAAKETGKEVAEKAGQSFFQKGIAVAKSGFSTVKGVGSAAIKAYNVAKPGLAMAKGMLFVLFIPVNEGLVIIGQKTMDLLITCHQGAADKLGDTVNAYAEADKLVHEALAALLQTVGISASPFEDPRENPAQLGEARTKAGSLYGGAQPRLDQQWMEHQQEKSEYLSNLEDRTAQRAADAASSDRSIAESQDASSYLVPPEAPTSEMENLRWSAGVVAGSVDWVIEKVTGVSLLNDVIFKYFSGDWRTVNMAGSAWSEIGDALTAVGQNDSEVLPALSEWTGIGSEVANQFITALSKVTTALRKAAGLMSTLLKAFASFLKQSAQEVGEAIAEIVNTALKLLAKSAIPVAGWVAAAADAVLFINKIIKKIQFIYGIINFIVDFIQNLAYKKAQMIEVQNTMSNLAEAATRRAAATA